jgi:hypothetical protein
MARGMNLDTGNQPRPGSIPTNPWRAGKDPQTVKLSGQEVFHWLLHVSNLSVKKRDQCASGSLRRIAVYPDMYGARSAFLQGRSMCKMAPPKRGTDFPVYNG